MRPIHRNLVVYLAWLVVASGATQVCHSQEAANSGLLVCAKLENGTERLTCYDRLAMQLGPDPARTLPPAAAMPPAMFGLTPATESDAAGKPVIRTALKSISARVTSLRENAVSGATLELDNGQRWQQIGHDDLMLQVGDTVKISRGAMKSFWVITPANRSAHVKRLN
jgi:hypothetical protein